MRNAPFIRLHNGKLEMHYWYPDSLGHKIGYNFSVQLEDGRAWRFVVEERSTCGMSTMLILQPFDDDMTPERFIHLACTSTKSVRPERVWAKLLETSGEHMLRSPSIEIKP